MRAGVATLVLFLVLATGAEARIAARLAPDGRVAVIVSGVTHVTRVVVRWGDGTRTTALRHRYAAPGTYAIRARILRRGRRPARTGAATVLVPGPVAAHHVIGYLVSDQLACGAASVEAGAETSACGTSLAVEGALYGAGATAFVPVTSYESGAGTTDDPYVITRVVRAGGRVELAEVTRYVVGSETAALTTYALRSVDGRQHVVVLYHSVDCAKPGVGAVTDTSVACQAPAAPVSTALTLVDLGQGGHRAEGTLRPSLTAFDDFPDTAVSGTHDTAIGLSWRVTLPTTSAATITEASQLVLSAG